MAVKIIMPKQGLQMTEGTITAWLANEGDKVNMGEPLFEMETDKLTITIDAPVSGTLLKIVAQEGASVPITETIAIVGAQGENISALLIECGVHGSDIQKQSANVESVNNIYPNNNGAQLLFRRRREAVGAGFHARPRSYYCNKPHGQAWKPAPTKHYTFLSVNSNDAHHARNIHNAKKDERIFISPRAKRVADELGVDWLVLSGSASNGMIVERDIHAANEDRATGLTPARMEQTPGQNRTHDEKRIRNIVPISGMRRHIEIGRAHV
jgi:pyruvate/2-oxoglutarate dehydrogenase complex dihydrolipoamide acyltransferase (E2) component